jgi:predicted transposase YbfD/YdcC
MGCEVLGWAVTPRPWQPHTPLSDEQPGGTTQLTRKGKRSVRRHLFLTTVRTTPQALLRLIRQRWSIENEWHWARDAQLGEDAHRYANRIGAPVFAFLRTIVMNLLSRAGYRSIRQGLRELAYDIKGMLALGGVASWASSN